jgi:NADPH:quinone reductase-like Zn-dependent oxidoreductase
MTVNNNLKTRTKMKAWQCDDGRPVPRLIQADVDPPKPGPDEILIKIHAVGVTPSELLWYPTTHTKSGAFRQHAIPGHEFSGTIAAAGAGVDAEIGQEVFGMNDWFAEGATAEFCCARPSTVAPKPNGLTHVEAASVPISALTAWQGLFDRARLQPGERVLIQGGSGAVGVFAIQLAHRRGAQVITTASARNREFLIQLGAQKIIDYRTDRFEDITNEVDVVFDAVGGSTLERSWGLLGPSGRLVTIAASGDATDDERVKNAFFIVEPDRVQLCEVSALLNSGDLRSVVDVEVPFDQADRTYTRQTAPTRGCGKSVVAVVPTRV